MDRIRKLFVAGGAGYIGTRLCNLLADSGEHEPDYEVTVLDHFWFGDSLDDRITKIKGEILDLKSSDLEGYDAVIFLAGLSNDPMVAYRPDLNFIQNSAAPTYLAYITKEAGIRRFIGASSCSVYGHTKNKTLTESSIVKPAYAYGISKLQCERGIMLLEADNFKPILFRKGTVGGWSERMRYDLVVNTMLMTALTKRKITVNSPQLWRPLLDIRDAIQGYWRAIDLSPDSEIFGVYNLSGGNYTIGELGKIIYDTLSERGYDIELEYLDIKDIRNYKVDITKIEEELDYAPRFTPVDTVQEILENINLDEYDFSDDKYYNINVFKKVM